MGARHFVNEAAHRVTLFIKNHIGLRLANPFFFTQVPFFYFLKKMQKMKIDYAHCLMRKFWRPYLGCLDRTMWESLRYSEKAALSALVCPG